MREGDRLYRRDPATNHPDALTVFAVGEATVTGQLDSGPLVTLPRTDIVGAADWPAAPAVAPIPMDDVLALVEIVGQDGGAHRVRGDGGRPARGRIAGYLGAAAGRPGDRPHTAASACRATAAGAPMVFGPAEVTKAISRATAGLREAEEGRVGGDVSVMCPVCGRGICGLSRCPFCDAG